MVLAPVLLERIAGGIRWTADDTSPAGRTCFEGPSVSLSPPGLELDQ
jgi:hypothetical protein